MIIGLKSISIRSHEPNFNNEDRFLISILFAYCQIEFKRLDIILNGGRMEGYCVKLPQKLFRRFGVSERFWL